VSDRIRLSGLEVFAHHGVYPEEAAEGQTFVVDVEIGLDLDLAGSTDDLDRTVDYGLMASTVHAVVSGERWKLIERVAQRVADVVMEDSRIDFVIVTIHKPAAPIPHRFADVSVTIERRR
jgi:dihydroneopterin aldolase